MSVKYEFYGEKVSRELQSIMADRLDKAATVLQQAVQSEAPVRTGNLREHVSKDVDRTALVANVFTTAPYAGKVNERNPFFDRAVAKSISEIERILGGS